MGEGRDRQDHEAREHQHLGVKPAVTFGGSDYNHKVLRVGDGGQIPSRHASPTTEATPCLSHRIWGLSRMAWVENRKQEARGHLQGADLCCRWGGGAVLSEVLSAGLLNCSSPSCPFPKGSSPKG